MQIKILFDSTALDDRFYTGWGISYLIDGKILFDTGEKSNLLFRNMKNMGIKTSDVKRVVISHDHWDHRDGLWGVLKKCSNLKVYACPNFTGEFKKKIRKLQGCLIETDGFIEISRNIFVTGEIAGTYQNRYIGEQALVIKTEKGISIITGCAHPGIIKIIEKVKKEFQNKRLYFVFGGFHLIDKDKHTIEDIVNKFIEMKIEKVGPTHCSGKQAETIFKKKYKNNFIPIKVGQTLDS